jgi:pimeloyl-ACP methyl ester carboxylesterase
VTPLPVVLVHGGSHGAWCWEPMLPFLDGPVLAVDLPPKRLRVAPIPPVDAALAAELAALKISDLAESIVADAEHAGFHRFVLVGHSMAGLSIPEVARRVPDRVEHLVFVSASIPPEGGCVIDTLPAEVREITRDAIARADVTGGAAGETGVLDGETARSMFCNDMDEDRTRFVLDRLCPESINLITETVSRLGVPASLPKTYVRLARDQSLPPDTQTQMIANLEQSPGGTVDAVELDSGHDVMVSHPRELAAVVGSVAAG